MHSCRKQSGFSLLEVLIGAAALGGLALMGAQLTKDSIKGQKTAESQMAKQNLYQLLMRYQSTESVCELNLNGKTFVESPTTGTMYNTAPLGNYKILGTSSPIDFLIPGGQYQAGINSNRWTYLGHQIFNRTGAFTGTLPAEGHTGEVEVIFHFEKGANDTSYGSKQVSIPIKSIVTAENESPSTYRITGCKVPAGGGLSMSSVCSIFGGTLVDNAPEGEGTEDVCAGIAGFHSNYPAGDNNISVGGGRPLGATTSGTRNVAIGVSSGEGITTGSENIIIGPDAGKVITTGNRNIIIGASAGTTQASAIATASNTILIGAEANFTHASWHDNNYINIGNQIIHRKAPGSDDDYEVFAPSGLRTTGRLVVEGTRSSWIGGPLNVSGVLDARNGLYATGATINGNLGVSGTASKTGGGTWAALSDKRTKTVTGSYRRGLQEILKVRPVYYIYRPEFGDNKKTHVGIVAQEIARLFPDAVSENKDGYLQVTLDPVIWGLVNATQEQQRLIDELKKENESLKMKMDEVMFLLKEITDEMKRK